MHQLLMKEIDIIRAPMPPYLLSFKYSSALFPSGSYVTLKQITLNFTA